MNTKDESLLVKVIKKAVGLPTASSSCGCGTTVRAASDCCGAEQIESTSSPCGSESGSAQQSEEQLAQS